jgi:hypothetical protein
MLDTHYFDQHVIADPEPRFPTAADIDLADRLRRKIEERYLHDAQNESGPAGPLRKAA